MADWFPFAVAAAVLYGLHQVCTRLAAERIGEGVGALVVELSAAASILVYLACLWGMRQWAQPISTGGVVWSVVTGVCVGVGTIAFFLLFQRGGPLSSVPMILAGGSALMAVIGFVAFREPVTGSRLLGVGLALLGLVLLRR